MAKLNKKASALLGTLVIGAAVGSIASLLLAPKEGKEVREYFYQKWKQSRFNKKRSVETDKNEETNDGN